jgi:uroporphyrin-III C-methyltransferase
MICLRMGTTGKKFAVALLALAVILGAGWWFLQAPSPTMVSDTVPLAVPDTKAPEIPPTPIDPTEPKLDPLLIKELSVSLRLVADSVVAGRDTQAALTMLELLEQRLASTASPTRLAELRSAVRADRERLAGASLPNLEEMKLALERLRAEVDALPNIFVPGSGRLAEPQGPMPALQPSVQESYWGRLWQALGQKVSEVVKVRRVEDRRASFRSPQEGRLLTEQLRFRLEMASVALETRNAAVFSRELATAQAILSQGFDADHPSVIAFRGALVQMQGQAMNLALPLPAASQRALERLAAGAAQ